MAMNLVEQQNVLRDLTDDMLQQAMSGGMAPPYLVLAEINRRKDARERYASQKAKYDANQATVAQDVMQQMAQATQAMQAPAMPPSSSGGLDSAMGAPMGMEPPVSGGLDAAAPAFADGGVVQKYAGGMSVINPSVLSAVTGPQNVSSVKDLSATPLGSFAASPEANNSLLGFKFNYPTYKNPYSSLMDLYQSQLGSLDKERENARAMALIAAGTGMMQGGQNTLKNIGAAFGPALQGYQTQIGSVNQAERDMLREQARLQGEAAVGEREFNKDFQNSMEGRAQLAERLGLKPGTSEYENYVVKDQLDSTAKGTMKNVIDTDTGEIKTAVVRNNKFYEPGTDVELSNVRLLDDVTKALKTAEGKGQIVDERSFKNATRGLAADREDYATHIEQIKRTKDFINENWYDVGDFKSLIDLPGSPVKELNGMLENISSGSVINTLMALREAGARMGQQGSGFGNLTEKEMAKLEKAVADLSASNKPQTILDNLDRFAQQYAKTMAAAEQDYQMAYEALIKNASETGDDTMVQKFISDNRLNDFDTPRRDLYPALKPAGAMTPDLGLGSKDEYLQ